MISWVPRVGAPLRGVRWRTEFIRSDYLPGSPSISLRTDATPSRPYLRHKRKGRPETGRDAVDIHAFFRSRVSAIGYQVLVSKFGCGLGETRFPTATR